MNLESAQVLVLRRSDSGESDRRLVVLTDQFGKIDVYAKGARKPKSRLAGISEPLATGTLSLNSSRSRYFVSQATPARGFPGLRQNYSRLCCALAVLEWVDALFPYGNPAPESLPFVVALLTVLEKVAQLEVGLIWIGLKLIQYGGFGAQFDRCNVCEAPIATVQGYSSTMSGGYLCADHATAVPDRIAVDREVLIGLQKVSELDAPPAQLRRSLDCLDYLMVYIEAIAERELAAMRSARSAILADKAES